MKLLTRLFCTHYWIKDWLDLFPDLFRYHCARCGKVKHFTHDPVNPVGLL